MNTLAEYKEQALAVKWESRPWFVTFSIKPDLYSLNVRNQFKKTIPSIIAILDNMTEKYVMLMETTKKSNVHYHALVQFKDNNSQMMGVLLEDQMKAHRVIGNTKVNDTQVLEENYPRTIEYLFKDYDKTHKILNFRGFNKPMYDNEICHIQDIYVKRPKMVIKTALLDNLVRGVALSDGVQEEDPFEF